MAGCGLGGGGAGLALANAGAFGVEPEAALGAAAGAAAAIALTSTALPQPGHLTFLPTRLSGAFSFALQEGQRTVTGMAHLIVAERECWDGMSHRMLGPPGGTRGRTALDGRRVAGGGLGKRRSRPPCAGGAEIQTIESRRSPSACKSSKRAES